MNLVRFPLGDLDNAPFEDGAPAPDRLIAGRPHFRTWTFEESADGKTFAGVWESSPGKWRIVYDEWEHCTILSGHSVITRDGGAAEHVKAGDSFVIRPGFTGTWEVVATTRKVFVVRLP